MADNGIVQKEMTNKYKKRLGEGSWGKDIMLDQVKVLKRKLADEEAANAKLEDTNSSLTEINEYLIDECAVKDGKIQSLNVLLSLAHQELKKHKVELTRKCQKNDTMTSELLELVDNDRKLLPRIKDELISNFYESTDGERWFF